ncbi:hypothetical protein MKW94_029066 [Papaver nudicaule]|uniref:Cytochrome P450 n=1 Tax=Papaver nudicaule TaxID=74823 RepID=A0AA41VXC3_PAPNU|nr:hypothetical protein [Papaver nudicaule]
MIGQSFSLLYAMKKNTAEKWVQERIRKYGPVSKLTLFGTPTVMIHGQAANKFLFTSDCNTLGNQQPTSIKRILGSRILFELSSDDHKRVRGALVSFLKPEVLKRYVGKMDLQVRMHFESHWQGKEKITTLSFNIVCSLLFGLDAGERRDRFVEHFQNMIGGMWSVPINLPFTRFNHSLTASSKVQSMIMQLVNEKRTAMTEQTDQQGQQQDLITCLLSTKDEENNMNNSELLTDQEIVDNVRLVMTAGYDTSSILLTFLIRLLANDPVIHASIFKEQEEIAKSKTSRDELLTWEDLTKMKYTWRVAMETLRMIPPIFGGFRKALKDVEFGGYLIPKYAKLTLQLTHSTENYTDFLIFWAASLTHMDESIFQEPSKFDPTRFENQSSTVPPYCFVAFGGGPRMCPGYEFARIETLITIHHLVTKFTWKFSSLQEKPSSTTPTPLSQLLGKGRRRSHVLQLFPKNEL